MSRPITRSDLVERYEALDYPNRMEFESKHGLPANLIGKMKMGWYSTNKSAASIARLEQALAAEEESKKRFGCWATPLAGGPVEPPPQGRPVQSQGTSLLPEDVEFIEELIDLINNSKDISEVDECGKKVLVALLKGLISDGTARVCQGLLSERRQSLHAKQEREEKAKAGRELTIRVVFVRDWVGGPLPNEVAAS
jgi:hypothetical protein